MFVLRVASYDDTREGVVNWTQGDREAAAANVQGSYVATYDPDAFDGLGHATFTEDPYLAATFASFERALEFWQAQSKVRPLRDDGKPNRPLTALSVEIVSIADSKETEDV